MKILCFFLTAFIPLVSFSQNKPATTAKPLYFQADRNGVQVLAQKFEYAILDTEKIRIGDILIDASTFNFQLIRSGNENAYRLKFKWPAGLLTQGQLILMNNNGKAILNHPIADNQIKISAVSSDEPNLRAELAEYTTDTIAPELLTTIKFLPFMNFCVSAITSKTKIYLCSRELYLSSQGKEIVIKERKTTQREASVEINGKAVGNQGVILLNDQTENIYFKATAESGAFLEIETRMKEVDFKDIVLTDDGQTLILTASGAEPVSQDKIVRLGDNLWQTRFPADRPIIYLKGDGGIPMRQEFYINGHVPNEGSRLYISAEAPEKTYSTSVGIRGFVPQGIRIQSANTDNQVKTYGKNRFEWDLKNIPRGITSHHYLSVDSKENKYIARYDIYGGFPYQFEGGLQYQTPSSIIQGFAHFQWWFEKFLAKFRWGLETDANIHFTKADNIAEYDEFRLELLYRFSPGLNFQEPVWGLGIPYSYIKGKDFTTGGMGLSFWGLRTPPSYFPTWIKWLKPKITYLTAGTGSDVKLTSMIEAELHAYSPLKENTWISYGLHYQTYTFDPNPTSQKPQIVLDAAYSTLF
jgi:hypothetical protein